MIVVEAPPPPAPRRVSAHTAAQDQHRHTFERSCSRQIGLRRIRIRRLDLRAEGSHEREIVAGELYRNSNSPPAVFGMSSHTEPYVLGPTKCGEIKTKYGVSTRLF
jgi:hypothetical protein